MSKTKIVRAVKAVTVDGAFLGSYCSPQVLEYGIDLCTKRRANCGPLSAFVSCPLPFETCLEHTLFFRADVVPYKGDGCHLWCRWSGGFEKASRAYDPRVLLCSSITLRELITDDELPWEYGRCGQIGQYASTVRRWRRAVARREARAAQRSEEARNKAQGGKP
jgi:hypothetical protein